MKTSHEFFCTVKYLSFQYNDSKLYGNKLEIKKIYCSKNKYDNMTVTTLLIKFTISSVS